MSIMKNFKAKQQQQISVGLLLLLLIVELTQAQLFSSNYSLVATENHETPRHPVEVSHLVVNGTTTISSGSSSGGSLLPVAPAENSQLQTTSNYYSNLQTQKFRVNVSNVCEKNQMRVTIRLNRPFYGLIHTKDKRRRAACSLEGTGEQSYSMDISYILNPNDPTHCGVVSHQLQPARHLNQSVSQSGHHYQKPQLTLSVVLVVRLHKSIEFSDDRYFLLSCANRCAKLDCSTGSDDESSSGASLARLAVGKKPSRPLQSGPYDASESIVSHTIRTNNQMSSPLDSGNGNKSTTEQQFQTITSSWPTEKCDTMLDLKFQWLVKLCWVLSTLLAVMVCGSLYLCLNWGHEAEKRLRQQNRDKRSLVNSQRRQKSLTSSSSGTNSRAKSSINHAGSKHVIYSPSTQIDAAAWSANNTSQQQEQHFLNCQLRDDLYLAKQQQRELMLANLNLMQANSEQCQKQVEGRHLILGRSLQPFPGLQTHQPLEARVRRRRSIGSSAALGLQDLQAHQAKLSASQRAKSRSQTTIHYDQGQDPFKAVPFNGNHLSGYQSDNSGNSATCNRVYLGSDFAGMEVYGMPLTASHKLSPPEPRLQTFSSSNHNNNNNNNVGEPMSQPLSSEPPGNATMNTMTRQDMLRKQAWANIKPTFVPPPPQIDMIQVQQGATKKLINPLQQQQSTQQQASSQFDPQNSRQLINLIQHKHRQQIEQANRTAASLQSSDMFATERQASSLSQQQLRANISQTQSRPPWR